MASLPRQGSTFEQQRYDKGHPGKRATQGSVALLEKQKVKPILQMSAGSISLDAVPLFDLKL